MSGEDLIPGARCRFTELGKLRSPKLAERTGIIVSILANKIIVLLDGNKITTAYHKSYVELLDAGSCENLDRKGGRLTNRRSEKDLLRQQDRGGKYDGQKDGPN